MPARPTHGLRSRDGFTIVELVIVMVIVAILIGMGLSFFHSSRRSAGKIEGVAAAMAYAQAIDEYATEHGDRAPRPIGSTDWPVGNEGPRDALARKGGLYLRNQPESVQSGAVGVGTAGERVRITYTRAANAFDYELRVVLVNGGYYCSIGPNLPSTSTSCSVEY